MKHGKRPTRKQKMLLDKLHLNPDNWLVVKDNPMELIVVHKLSGKQRRLVKV